MNPVQRLDRFLNNITMYRLVLYGLRVLVVISLGLSLTHHLSLPFSGLVISFVSLVAVCLASNWLLSRFWPAVTNKESYIISALILGFILPPVDSLRGWLLVLAAGVIAMAAKYLLAPHGKHLFNPAALAAVVLGVANLLPATWWVGNPVLLPFTAIFGLLLLRKLHRFSLFGSFLVVSLVTTCIVTLLHHVDLGDALSSAFTSSPLIFLGTVMLTEPFTMPPRLRQQVIYGTIVGAIFSAQLQFGRLSSTPELALIAGNLFSYLVSPKYKLLLRLKERVKLAENIYELRFASNRQLAFQAGQYLEWTLPVAGHDSRGNRRSFSIASSPTNQDIHLGTKAVEPLRGFKKALFALQPGDTIVAGQLSGNFVLPKDTTQKLVLVAGGIGITPFISMLQHQLDGGPQRDIVLFYMLSKADEFSYRDILQRAEKHGVKVVPVLSTSKGAQPPTDWTGSTGYLTKELLTEYAPDYAERRFYLSGPNAMVQGYRKLLQGLGVPRRAIVSDYFSGY